MVDKNKKYPEGHFLGVGMAIGIACFSGVGIAISNSTGNPGLIGIGPAIGVGIGLLLGKAMEEKYRKEGKIRPLTKKEKESKEKAKKYGIIALIVGIILLALIFLVNIIR